MIANDREIIQRKAQSQNTLPNVSIVILVTVNYKKRLSALSHRQVKSLKTTE